MKLRLYWKFNSSAATNIDELPLMPRDEVPLEQNRISAENSVLENGYYQISLVYSSNELEAGSMVYLYLNDQRIAIATTEKTNTDENICEVKFKLENNDAKEIEEKSQIFLLNYDLVYLSVQICKETEVFYDTEFMFCRNSYNNENLNVITMLDILLNFPDEEVNRWIFPVKSYRSSSSSTFLDGGYKSGASKSLVTLCELIQEVYMCFYKNYPIFKQKANRKVREYTCKNNYHNARVITTDEFKSIIYNLDSLDRINQRTAIEHLGAYYLPKYVETKQLISSTDIFENQVVLGFLEIVHNEAGKILHDYSSAYNNEVETYRKYKQLEDKWGRIPILSVKQFILKKSELLLDKLQKSYKGLSAMLYTYRIILKCKPLILHSIPQRTKPFLYQKNYVEIYELIKKWFFFGDFSFKKEALILKIKKLDKLYEYFCLFNLLKMLKNNNYYPKFSNSIYSYDYETKSPSVEEFDIPNTYVLSNGIHEITLYYQPNIFAVNSPKRNGISLYLTYIKYNRTQFRTPDFIMKIRTNDKETYVIMDSKFSIGSTIRDYNQFNILEKYLLPVASENKYYPPICSICLLQGRDDRRTGIKNFYNTELSEQFHPIPSYCLNVLNGKYYNTDKLWNEIERCSIQLLH